MATPAEDLRRTVRPGDMVVSLNEILNRLQSQVNPGVLDDLLRDVLANRRNQVRPGEIITAELMNQILGQLESLEVRVAFLEAKTPPGESLEIIDIIPSGVLRVGQEVQITGRGFGVSVGAQRVSIDGVPVTNFDIPRSNNERLVFSIPPISAPQSGKQVSLVVSNGINSVQRIVTLLPATTTQNGDVTVGFIEVSPGTITPTSPPSPVLFQYRLRSRALLPASFLLTPTVSGVPNATEWQNRLQILNNAQIPVVDRRIALEPNQETIFFVQLSSVPSTPTSGNISLRVDATAEGVRTGADGPRSFPLGAPVPDEDETIFLASTFADPSSALVGTEIRRTANSEVTITLNLTFTVAGEYHLSAAVVEGTNWKANVSLASLNPMPVDNVPSTKAAKFVISAGDSPSASGRVELRVQRKDSTQPKTFPLILTRS